MVIFHCYVSSPEGKSRGWFWWSRFEPFDWGYIPSDTAKSGCRYTPLKNDGLSNSWDDDYSQYYGKVIIQMVETTSKSEMFSWLYRLYRYFSHEISTNPGWWFNPHHEISMSPPSGQSATDNMAPSSAKSSVDLRKIRHPTARVARMGTWEGNQTWRNPVVTNMIH